jgi:diguanylate cyclase (GGDEF)-like protein/PAS domain S-box-containing protein
MYKYILKSALKAMIGGHTFMRGYINNFFLKVYENDSFLIKEKSKTILFCELLVLIFMPIFFCIHTFSLINALIFQIGEVISFIFTILALFFLKRHSIRLSVNVLYLSCTSLLIIHNVIGDWLLSQPLTHFRVLETVVSFCLVYFIISLTAVEIYQSIFFVIIGDLTVLAHIFVIIQKVYTLEITETAVSHFLAYIVLSILGSSICFRILKLNNEAINFLDKKNEEFEQIINERTKKLSILLAEKEKYYIKALENEAKFKGMVENAPDIVFILDINNKFTFVSSNVLDIVGFDQNHFIGKKCSEIFLENDIEIIKDLNFKQSNSHSEGRIKNIKGKYQWFSLHTSPVILNNEEHFIGIARDISEKRNAEELLITYATTDEMTSALNRRVGLKTLENYLSSGNLFSVCYIDLDGLKQINDRYGHDQGDYAINTIVKIIIDSIKSTDVIARVGGDEFILILPKYSIDEATSLCNEIVAKLKTFNNLRIKPYDIAISFGCEECGMNSYNTIDDLMNVIDHRMYLQKRTHKQHQ